MAVALALGGCSSSILDWPGNAQADAPDRSKDAAGFLPVHDLPPDREEAVIPPAERAKIESELISARDHQVGPGAKDKDASAGSNDHR